MLSRNQYIRSNRKDVVRHGKYGQNADIWSSLRRYRDISYTSRILHELHAVPKRKQNNVRKQSEQISFSILQAEEYWKSAAALTSATNPLLYYYGVMCMALTELLWKQTGDVSLDRARDEHAHHGLKTTLGPGQDLLERAIGKPHYTGTGRSGTFELWRRSASHSPLHAIFTDYYPEMSQTITKIFLGHSEDNAKLIIPENGVTLKKCLMMLPAMVPKMYELGFESDLVRGKIEISGIRNRPDEYKQESFILHPCSRIRRDKIMEKFVFPPSDVNAMTMTTGPNDWSGFILNIRRDSLTLDGQRTWPDGFPYKDDEIWIWDGDNELNEFGYIYVASYICGMITRYFPDIWMKELKNTSAACLAVESLMETISWRAPMLLLGELSGSVFLLEK